MNLYILSRAPRLYSTSRMVEEAQKAGHKVAVIDPLKCDIKLERHKPSVYYKGQRLLKPDAIIPRVGASITFYGTAIVRQFETMNCFTTVSSQALVRSRDKLQSLQKLSSAGVGMPKTVFTNFGKHTDQIIADLRVFVVGDKVVGAMKRQAQAGEFRSNLHRGGSAVSIKLSREEELTAIAAAKSLGLGVCGVDLLQSKRGPLVLEVNSSPGLEGIEGATKNNIAGAIIKYIERHI